MSLPDNLANMLKDIFGYDLEASQRCNKATRQMSMIMEISSKLRGLIGEENSGWILMKIRST